MQPETPKGGEVFPLDIITIGRASVDIYGQQIGARLEDTVSFQRSVGGCPANIAIGTSRLGLKSAMITRIGDEAMGAFIREHMQREGVETRGVITDPHRLTALVLLGVENDKAFPTLFYRENCADMALDEGDIDESLIASARSILVTGTHFSRPNTQAAQKKAMTLAHAHGAKVIFDIDYRPNLWGLAGHRAGEERYIASDTVSNRLKPVLAQCDLIVGTEEEVLIAAGEHDLLSALKTIRKLAPQAILVLKRGPMGCIIYDGAIPDILDQGIVGQGFPIEVYNTLGAGDAFLSGFLRGYLRGEALSTCATWANACGAFAVSRLLCSAEIPSFEELTYFLTHGSPHKALRRDPVYNHIHWATTQRAGDIPQLMALAIDHRAQLVELCQSLGVDEGRISRFKQLAVAAASRVARGRPGFGMLIDERFGRDAFFDAMKHEFSWIGRPVEVPGSRPLRFEFSQDMGSQLISWPISHTIKALCFYHPDDPADLKEEQQQKLLSLYEAARKVGRELLIEIIASKHGPLEDDTAARVLSTLYALGIKPDWWKLEPQASALAWQKIGDVIAQNDVYCRGVVLLGLEAPEEELEKAFAATASAPCVKGFAVGRTIFMHAARQWLSGTMSDEDAIGDMEARFETLTQAWMRR